MGYGDKLQWNTQTVHRMFVRVLEWLLLEFQADAN
jgi:hypothetical protein